MTILRALGTIAICTLLLASIGGGVGWGLGTFAPNYYRNIFRNGRDPGFDPISMGVGQGLTQGTTGGVFVGLFVVALFVWRDRRRQLFTNPTPSLGNAPAVNGSQNASLYWHAILAPWAVLGLGVGGMQILRISGLAVYGVLLLSSALALLALVWAIWAIVRSRSNRNWKIAVLIMSFVNLFLLGAVGGH